MGNIGKILGIGALTFSLSSCGENVRRDKTDTGVQETTPSVAITMITISSYRDIALIVNISETYNDPNFHLETLTDHGSYEQTIQTPADDDAMVIHLNFSQDVQQGERITFILSTVREEILQRMSLVMPNLNEPFREIPERP